MRALTVALCSVLCACSAGDIETIYDPCSPMVIVPGPGTDPDERESISDAVEVWSAILPVQIEVADEPEGSPALPIYFQTGDTFYRAMYFDERAEIWVSRETLAPADRALAIAHELGHAFGLFHVSEELRPSVMNVGNLEVVPNVADGDAVTELWPSCAPGGA